jgi:hypothetical protein
VSKRRVKVRVDKRGKVTVEMEGFQGAACLDVLKKLLASLGRPVTLTPTAEYFLEEQKATVYEYEGEGGG